MSSTLSVVMPVHNVRPYLDEAIESILLQTFSDFEFVILDDASADGSRERLREWAARDERIRLIESHTNLGPVGSSNRVASAASAPFVARMDADDISAPERLAEEITLLRAHPDMGVVGSLCEIIDGSGKRLRGPELWRLSRPSVFVPFAHGTIMYRREIFDRVGGYREECEYWEDEDIDFGLPLLERYDVRHNPSAICHQRSVVGPREYMRRARSTAEADLAFAAKHPQLEADLFERRGASLISKRLRLLSRLPLLPHILAETATAAAEIGLHTPLRSSRVLARLFNSAYLLTYWSTVRRNGGDSHL